MNRFYIIDSILKEAVWLKQQTAVRYYYAYKDGVSFGFGASREWLNVYVEKISDDQFKINEINTKATIVKKFGENIEKYFNLLPNYTFTWTLDGLISYLRADKEGAIKVIDKSIMYFMKSLVRHNDFKTVPPELFYSRVTTGDKKKLFDILVGKNKLSVSIFESLFGQAEATERITKTTWKNWEIFFDVKTKRDPKDIIELLDNTEQVLSSKGFKNLCYGKVVAVDSIGGKTLADYDVGGDLVRIGFKELKAGRIITHIDSLVHELGHRNFFKFLNAEKQKETAIKYEEKKSIHGSYKMGDTVIDTNSGDKFMILEEQYSRGTINYLAMLKEITGKGMLEEKINKVFKIPYQYLDVSFISEDKTTSDKTSFFPNSYALKNYKEFYAVLFNYWILDKLTEPAKSWMVELHK